MILIKKRFVIIINFSLLCFFICVFNLHLKINRKYIRFIGYCYLFIMIDNLFISTNIRPRELTLQQLEEESQNASIDRWNIEAFVKDRKSRLMTSLLMFIDSVSLTFFNLIF